MFETTCGVIDKGLDGWQSDYWGGSVVWISIVESRKDAIVVPLPSYLAPFSADEKVGRRSCVCLLGRRTA
jgi:hypothetical protein